MLIFSMGFLAVALMVICFVFKRPAFGFGASGMWFVTAIDSYTLAGTGFTVWNIYALFSFACFGMAIVSIMEALAVRVPREEDIVEDNIDRQISKMEAYRAKMDRLDTATGERKRPEREPAWVKEWDKKYSK